MARRPLPEGQALTAKLMTKVRPADRVKFQAECARRGTIEAQALREALTDWMEKPR